MTVKRPALAVGAVLTFVVAGIALVHAATLFLQGYGQAAVDAQVDAVQAAKDPVVQEYRAEQARELESARWIDREAGTVKLPIERAMELVVEESNREGAR